MSSQLSTRLTQAFMRLTQEFVTAQFGASNQLLSCLQQFQRKIQAVEIIVEVSATKIGPRTHSLEA